MQIPLDPLDKARLHAAFLECQLNAERLKLLQIQLEEERNKETSLQTKLKTLIDELCNRLEISDKNPTIDLEEGIAKWDE